jgi:tRNA/rRNA methyltransferase
MQRVRVVLVNTSHPGNIGSAARAMMTMGLANLYLVQPRRFPDPEATALAAGAQQVLNAAKCCSSLDEALQGTIAAFGLSARRRDLSHRALAVREGAVDAWGQTGSGDVALVFGNEMSGLSNDELIRCSALVHIPTDPGFSSLNLAQAVQVMAYELRMAAGGGETPSARTDPLASHEAIEQFYTHLQRILELTEFLDPHKPRRLMERLRRLFGRVRLEQEEINILRGILTSFEVFGDTLRRRMDGGEGRPSRS